MKNRSLTEEINQFELIEEIIKLDKEVKYIADLIECVDGMSIDKRGFITDIKEMYNLNHIRNQIGKEELEAAVLTFKNSLKDVLAKIRDQKKEKLFSYNIKKER
jgi:hypothetical protein